MSISWINAAALGGLALIAIPIAIHLLVRQQTRSVAYPSLRFVRETALAAFRRRAIQDAMLLACRVAIVGGAAIALAGPILQTDARTAAYASRVSRAIVPVDNSPVAAELTADVFRATTIRRTTIADALSDAVRWLDEQPPSSREIVVTGALMKGQVDRGDLALVPDGIGVRFARSGNAAASERVTQVSLTERDGQLVFARSDIRLSTDSTRVTAAEASPAPPDTIRIIAPVAHQALADAALTAVLEAGVRWPDAQRRLVVVWEGADSPSTTAGTAVARMAVPDPPRTAASALRRAIEAALPAEHAEIVSIAAADLENWSRPGGGVAAHARPADEGDRRWVWAAVLFLLALEHWLRRDRTRAVETELERRVA